jgi:hypothetical protein
MKHLSIGNATNIYGDASECLLTRHWVDHSGLDDLSRQMRALTQRIGENVEDEFWRNTVGPLRRFAFTLCSAPVPFAHVSKAISVDWDKMMRQARLCEQVYPDESPLLNSVLSAIHKIRVEETHPFLDSLKTINREYNGIAVLMRNHRLNRLVAEYFQKDYALRSARVVSAEQLRGSHLAKALVAIGPCAWFPEYVFTAPRVRAIHIVSFKWIKDTWQPRPHFLQIETGDGTDNVSHRVGAFPSFINATVDAPTVSLAEPIEVRPPLPTFTQHLRKNAAETHGIPAETISARFFHLAGGRAVFLPTDDSSSSLVIDTSEVGHAIVKRVPNDELQPGNYLLLRTTGGGDFIAPLADQLLGDKAASLRSEQREWKSRVLLQAESEFGPLNRRELSSRICARLNVLLAADLRPANVLYWISSKCIHPRSEQAFHLILEYAGLGDRSISLRKSMEVIDRAHRRAGHHIRRMLLNKISQSSLELLERDGHMEFELSEEDGGSLSAFHILEVADDEVDVAPEQVGILLDMDL